MKYKFIINHFLHTKNDFKRRRSPASITMYILLYIYIAIIVIIYFAISNT